jgi:hypothetical protein
MRTVPLLSCALTLLATTLPVTQPVSAGTGIQRCEDPNGTVVYTDRSCEAFGAKHVPMSGELLTRIAQDGSGASNATDVDFDSLRAIGAPAPARRSAQTGCARSSTQLAMDLQGSLALRDVNRLSESYHWVGHSHDDALPVLARLDRLTQQPLYDLEYFDAQIGPAGLQFADAGALPGDGMAGMMQLSFGEDGVRQVVDFRVRRYSGCYFIEF